MTRLILLLLCMLICAATFAQADNTVLIYERFTGGQYTTVYLNSNGSSSNTILTNGICGGSSPNGLFSAFSLQTTPSTLDLIYRPTNFTFAQIPWRANWYPCSTAWLDDQTFIVRELNNFSNVVSMFRVIDNVLQEVPVSLPLPNNSPSLPFAYDTALQYIIPSNNGAKYYYESCPNEPIIPPNQLCIGSQRNYVIYDLTLQRNVGIISDSIPRLLSGRDPSGPVGVYSVGYYSWSPNDRYFWYSTINEEGADDFRIYDTVLERSLESGGFNWTLDLYRKPVWSADSRYVAFWVVGPPGYEGQDPNVCTINVYDTTSESLIPINLGFEIDDENPIVWSPNTSEFVTWDKLGNLYRVNVETPNYTIIDVQVTNVIAWSFVEPIPIAATPTPTPALNTVILSPTPVNPLTLSEETRAWYTYNITLSAPLTGSDSVTVRLDYYPPTPSNYAHVQTRVQRDPPLSWTTAQTLVFDANHTEYEVRIRARDDSTNLTGAVGRLSHRITASNVAGYTVNTVDASGMRLTGSPFNGGNDASAAADSRNVLVFTVEDND